MGVVTIAVAIAVASGRKIGLMQRSTMQEAISAHQVGGIVRLTKFILKTSIFIELIGAALLMPVFCKDFGILKGLWYSLFTLYLLSATPGLIFSVSENLFPL